MNLVEKIPQRLQDQCYRYGDQCYCYGEELPGITPFSGETEEGIIPWLRHCACTLLCWIDPYYWIDSVVRKLLADFNKEVQSCLSYFSQVINSAAAQYELISSPPGIKLSTELNVYWPADKLTKPIIFVVDNANWLIRCSLLSTPLVPALYLSSRSHS